MAAAAILEKFQMAIAPQRLTIYSYSAHRAVIFAIAQLSCTILGLENVHVVTQITRPKWLGLAAGQEAKLKKLEQTAIDKRIFLKTEICVRECKVMASGSEGGSSTDVALRWKKVT